MPSTFRIPKARITGLYGRALTAYARRSWGQVPDNAYVLWHNRKVMKAVFSFEQKVAKFDALDRELSVLAQAATAARVGCSWCLDFGYYLAHGEGMDLEKVREVMRWRDSDVFSPVEREVLAYAEAMSTTPLTVTDEMVASLIEHLGEEAVVELTMMVAIENECARFNSAAGLKAQGFSDVCEIPLPPLVSTPPVVGRARERQRAVSRPRPSRQPGDRWWSRFRSVDVGQQAERVPGRVGVDHLGSRCSAICWNITCCCPSLPSSWAPRPSARSAAASTSATLKSTCICCGRAGSGHCGGT